MSNTQATGQKMSAVTISVEDARSHIMAGVESVSGVESVALRDGLGRVLAETLFSPMNVPPHENAAMDGYAIQATMLQGGPDASLRVLGRIFAGDTKQYAVGRGECWHIMTGARLPEGCDAVIAQECVEEGMQPGEHAARCIRFAPSAVSPGDNCRRAGEDLAAGATAITAGTLLQPAHLGVAASLGIQSVQVRPRLKVAFFSTGDELRALGQALDPGCIYDSNRYILLGMLLRLGCEAIDLGIVPDNPVALEAAVQSASAAADVVISSGGMSGGSADHVGAVLSRLGTVAHWHVNMKPGRPLAFGHLHSEKPGVIAFGLPGNPVAVMAAFYVLVRPALQKIMGMADRATIAPMFQARLTNGYAKKPGRQEFLRAIQLDSDSGIPQVSLVGAQGAGMLSSMTKADCFVMVNEAQGELAPGQIVTVMPFDGLV